MVGSILGEADGELVSRTWSFAPGCPLGPCATVVPTRQRGATLERLALRRRTATYYVGTGSFFVALGCGDRVVADGESAPYTIGVQLTGATLTSRGVVATAIRAFYVNPSRTNLTPCIAFPGHDAAVYAGRLAGV